MPATVGIIAAAYRNGPIVLVAPGLDATAAAKVADLLRNAIAQLRIVNSESIVADHFTAGVAAVTGRLDRAVDPTGPRQEGSDRTLLISAPYASISTRSGDQRCQPKYRRSYP